MNERNAFKPVWTQMGSRSWKRSDGAAVWMGDDYHSNPLNPRSRMWEGSGPLIEGGTRLDLLRKQRTDRRERFSVRRRFGSAESAMQAVDAEFPLTSHGSVMEKSVRKVFLDYDARRTPKTDRFCVRCQKDISPDSPARVVRVLNAMVLHPDDAGSVGDCFLVGLDCARLLGLDYSTPEAKA